MLSIFKLHLPLPSGQATMSLAYTVDFVALLLCGADAAMLVAVVGVLVQCGVGNADKKSWVRTLFSIAAVAIAVQASGLAWSQLGGDIDALGLSTTIGPMSAAATAYFVVNTTAIALAIALTAGTSPKAAWRGDFLWIAPSYFLSAAIGAMVAIILSHGVYALLLLAAAPLYISHRAYRASVDRIDAERLHARELAQMVGTTKEALSRATHSETALVAEKERLALERTRLATTLQTITEAVVTVDSNGSVLLMNESAETLIGVDASTAIDRPVTDLFTILGVNTADHEEAMRRVLADGQPARLRCELTVPSARVVEITGTPMRTGTDRVAGAVWVLRDVTDEARVEQERSKTARLESLGVLAGGLAHDFNNILMGVVGNLSLAESLVRDGEQALAQRLREAEAACVRARGVTSQLLTFAKGGAPVKITASISELVTECARFALSGSPVAVRFTADDDLWSVDVDTVQVSQVVHNLVLNAMQAMSRGGTVHIIMRNVRVDAMRLWRAGRPAHRPLRLRLGDRSGRRHPGGAPVAHLRALLHNQGKRIRSRTRDLVIDRAGAWRRDARGLAAGDTRHALRCLLAGVDRQGHHAGAGGHRGRRRTHGPRPPDGRRPDGLRGRAGHARHARLCHRHGRVRPVRPRTAEGCRSGRQSVRPRDPGSHRARRDGGQGSGAPRAAHQARHAGAGDERIRRQHACSPNMPSTASTACCRSRSRFLICGWRWKRRARGDPPRRGPPARA